MQGVPQHTAASENRHAGEAEGHAEDATGIHTKGVRQLEGMTLTFTPKVWGEIGDVVGHMEGAVNVPLIMSAAPGPLLQVEQDITGDVVGHRKGCRCKKSKCLKKCEEPCSSPMPDPRPHTCPHTR